MTTRSVGELRGRFAELHGSGTFLLPNAWDVGSARTFASLGFEAVATTSSGLGASLGRHDQTVTLPELLDHVTALTTAIDIPVSVDAEDGYAATATGLADTVSALAGAGASGISIEDYRQGQGILELGEAVARVEAYAAAATPFGMTVTARVENHLYGVSDLDDTIARLRAYGAAGAHVVYAPGLTSSGEIGRVVEAVSRPVNVLLLPGGPTVAELSQLGVRRISTGGALAFVAYGAAAKAARVLRDGGTSDFFGDVMSRDDRDRAFGAG